MIVEKTYIDGLLVIQPKIFNDSRGYFYESFNSATFGIQTGVDINFVQDNESKSSFGVLRGLHYQLPPFAQSKLVRVIVGEVWDIAVDIREGSPTYGHHFGVLLSEQNKKQFFIPRGFAHGFVVLSNSAVFSYKCDNFYNKESEGGIKYNDKKLDIGWNIDVNEAILSEKDLILPKFGNHIKYF